MNYADQSRLRTLSLQREKGAVVFRCPAEPVEDLVKKGGTIEETEGRKCLCNGLMASVGPGQLRGSGTVELPLTTAGNELSSIIGFLEPNERSYSAKQVVQVLVDGLS